MRALPRTKQRRPPIDQLPAGPNGVRLAHYPLWEQLPTAVPGAVLRLVDGVEDMTAGLGAQGRRWLAAALAVLSEDLEVATDRAGRDPRLRPARVTVRAVIAGSVGVLAGRRRDGEPLWVLPSGPVGPEETPAQAAVRAGREQTGLPVRVEREIGRCRLPTASRQVIYLECTPTTCAALRVSGSGDLVELQWLDRAQVDALVPDLPRVVRSFLQLRYVLESP